MELARGAYALGRELRRLRHSALATQIERAAVSIPANIAEGSSRASPAEFARFANISIGSLRELETLLDLAQGLCDALSGRIRILLSQADEVGRVLYGLQQSLRAKAADLRRPTRTTAN